MKQRLYVSFLTLYYGIIAVIFYLLSLNRYYAGQIFYYDFGIFSRIIWQLAHFQLPIINHLALGNILFLGDHFNPGLVLISPLYWFTSDPRVLLFQQAMVTALSGLVIFLISKKHQLATTLALSISTTFLLFAGTENPLVTDWHPESTSALFLLLFYYFFAFTTKRWLTLLSAIIFLSLKESNAIALAVLTLFLAITDFNKRRVSLIYWIGSVAYFFITTKILIPYFSNHPYLYTPDMPTSPIDMAKNMLNGKEKIKLIYDSFLSFGFIPFISGFALLLPLSELAIRLIPNATIFNNLTLGQHYNVLLGVFLALATIVATKKITNATLFRYKKIIPIILTAYLLCISLYTARKITGSPINLVANSVFWDQLKPNPVLFETLKKVPHEGSIMSQNNLLAYLVNRKDNVYFLRNNYENYNPDIIFFDLRPDQNKNNYYGTQESEIVLLKENLKQDPKYKRVDTSSYIYLFIKNR